jgi:hypothetical protein
MRCFGLERYDSTLISVTLDDGFLNSTLVDTREGIVRLEQVLLAEIVVG